MAVSSSNRALNCAATITHDIYHAPNLWLGQSTVNFRVVVAILSSSWAGSCLSKRTVDCLFGAKNEFRRRINSTVNFRVIITILGAACTLKYTTICTCDTSCTPKDWHRLFNSWSLTVDRGVVIAVYIIPIALNYMVYRYFT